MTLLRPGAGAFVLLAVACGAAWADEAEDRAVQAVKKLGGHVRRDDKVAKFWLEPVRLEYNQGFPAAELQRVTVLVQEHRATLVREWNAYFRTS